ncbi:hypothetical protein [Gordonia sp. 852002-51296_SCH5728562-b]|uniref:hypothetical protein n=1 Tax=Gordonia sp. 852002-51296_SCH5728562-b TaxID=1834101 RepID=UPI0007EA7A4A|nr:hypothetical protein [Gordonia sp. 852002-51296_SCH5728562-b]OBA31644.1 hypothetical protein A5766_13745 [Gordonia sp. 852002-51296_SCH5728562-b]
MSVPNFYDAPEFDENGLPCQTATLADVHAAFTDWLGDDYDTDALDAVLAAAAVEQLDGDPLWLLLISGSGNAKPRSTDRLLRCGEKC